MTERDEKEEERVNACILLHECAHDELVVSRRGVIINVVGLYVACPESAVTNGLLLPDETARKAIYTPHRNFQRGRKTCCTHDQRRGATLTRRDLVSILIVY